MMTQPTVIFFGPDGRQFNELKNKIYLRTLLYSTAKKGQVIESLYVSIHRNQTKQNFNIWVYGDKDNLNRGSGLFVPQEGITCNHHFLLPEDGVNFQFLEGQYNLNVFAKVVGNENPIQLYAVKLVVNHAHALELAKPNTGIYFDWGPDQQSYHPYIDKRPKNVASGT